MLVDGEVVADPEAMAPADAPAPDPLPADAQALIAAFDKEATAIQKKAQQEIVARQKQLVEQLQKLQDSYTKPGTLDAAVAVRDRIRQLKAALLERTVDTQPDPGNMARFRGHKESVYHFRVTGSVDGPVWGTAIYTDDSSLSTAAVHSGLVRPGQTAIVKVTLLPGQAAYTGSENNGVRSHSYSDWGASYRLEAP